jgi:hypothetical protein
MFWVILSAEAWASSTLSWMGAAELRAAFPGQTVTGSYVSGEPFTETYFADGAITYIGPPKNGPGRWSIWGSNFCTFYEDFNGACFLIRRAGRNCFQAYVAENVQGLTKESEIAPWLVAQLWRKGEPSSCPNLPIA